MGQEQRISLFWLVRSCNAAILWRDDADFLFAVSPSYAAVPGC
jgi:hypothetical protein